MNRHDFIKLAVAGFGTMLASGAAINFLSNKNTPEANVPAAEAAQQPTPDGKQRIVVITSSPHRNGTTSVLAEEFIKGAESKGHNVFRFDAAFHDIHPCQGCDACGMNGPCVQKDDIENGLIMRLVDADLIALISPVYYWHVSAQLKTCIDRFYARTGRISGKQSVLLAAAGSDVPWAMDCLNKYYATLSGYMRWQSRGTVLATNCKTREDILKTTYPQAAYNLGHSL